MRSHPLKCLRYKCQILNKSIDCLWILKSKDQKNRISVMRFASITKCLRQEIHCIFTIVKLFIS